MEFVMTKEQKKTKGIARCKKIEAKKAMIQQIFAELDELSPDEIEQLFILLLQRIERQKE
jgi:hypothetical protein